MERAIISILIYFFPVSTCFVGFFFLNLSVIDLQHYVSSGCTIQWFDISICCKMISMVFIVTVTKILQYNWLYFSCCISFPYAFIFIEWKWSRSVMSDFLRPVDCSPPSSSVHGILQARILECVAISFSSGSCNKKDIS